MKIVNRKISELIHAEYNPRQLTEDQHQQLKDSLARFGFVDPVIINKHSERLDIIVGGHQRCKVWAGMGNSEVPTVEVDLTPDKEKELNIRLNKNSGDWDYDMLANYFDTEELMEWGFQEKELGFFSQPEAEEDDYEIPDEIKTDIVLGDLIEIGEHRLLCGDSTEVDGWRKLCEKEVFDLVVTDPPYNVALGMETVAQAKARNRRIDGKVVKNDKMSDSDFYQFLYDFFTAMGSYTKQGGSWYVWHADAEVVNFRKAMEDSGIMVKQGLVWKKSSIVMGRQDYQWIHEPCLYGWKEGAAHNWYSDRKQPTILEFDKPSRSENHPTMKPIPLISYQITNSSKKDDLIGDGFLGSGSTMAACEQLNRKCYGMELDPKYCQVIVDRMAKLNPELTIKINGEVLL